MTFFTVLQSISLRLTAVDQHVPPFCPGLSHLRFPVFKTYGQYTFPPLSSLLPDSWLRLPERGAGRRVAELTVVVHRFRHVNFLQPCLGPSGIL